MLATCLRMLPHLQDGSSRSSPIRANLLEERLDIPASRGLGSRVHRWVKRCEQARELYLPGGAICSHWLAVRPRRVCAQ